MARINNLNKEPTKQLFFYSKSQSQTKEDETGNLSKEQKMELDKRYDHFLEHHEEYADWDDVKSKYIKE